MKELSKPYLIPEQKRVSNTHLLSTIYDEVEDETNLDDVIDEYYDSTFENIMQELETNHETK